MTTIKTDKNSTVPARVTLALLTSLGVVTLYMGRINMSVAIVAMYHTPPTHDTGHSPKEAHTDVHSLSPAHTTAFCIISNKVNLSTLEETLEEETEVGVNSSTIKGNTEEEQPLYTMALTGTQKGLVLGAFFYGYFATNIPGGRLAEVYGTKRVFGGAILVGGVLTFFTPLAAHAHYTALIILRLLIGLAHGVVYPAMNVMVSKWVPPLERPRFMSFTYMSNTLGTIITMPLCGVIIAWAGWAEVFYVTGGVSLAWVVLWAWLMHDTPLQHPSITAHERDYILNSIKEGTTQHKAMKIPWRSILKSGPLWATHIAHIGSMFGFNLLLTQLPTYMSSVLGFSIKTNGLLSALPFMTQFLGSIVCGVIGDWLLTRHYLSLNTSRKLFATTCTLLGLSNTLAYMVSMCVPVIVGAMTPNQSLKEWQSVFWLTAVMYITSWMVFVVFGTTKIQPWNYQEDEEVEGQRPSREETKFLKTKEETEEQRP
ncbi:sialin-like isoform X2 [Cherax quadricarinatus]|uniref:sialin-like isoform X2 n=1 Tax=Cherax quadricarinatus TaxID=27406 RepID=UPI00387E5BC9